MREAPRPHTSPRSSPRPPLTLADLRTPSPSPAPMRHLGAKNHPPRKEGGRVVGGIGSGAMRTSSPGAKRSTDSPRTLRLSHLAPAPAPASPSPPASCSSFYDSINSEGPPRSSSPNAAPDRLMQVEVAFEWSPVSPSLAPRWPPSPSPGPASTDPPQPWPPDSLEGVGLGATPGLGFEASGRVRSQLAAMNGAAERGIRLAGRPRGVGAPTRRSEQDLNSRVHQILARIASGGH